MLKIHRSQSPVESCSFNQPFTNIYINSVQFSGSVMSDSLQPHGLQLARPPCPSPTPWVHSNSCLLSRWCHPTISSSVIPFPSHLQTLPASGSFEMSQLFASEAKVLEFQLHQSFQWTPRTDFFRMDWLYLLAVQGTLKRSPQLKSINSSVLNFLYSPTHIHTWPLEKP